MTDSPTARYDVPEDMWKYWGAAIREDGAVVAKM
jgi:hypothetical protein